jgi:predicted DNA-binding protein
MARPKKGSEKTRPNRVAFRVTDEVRDGLDALSAARGLPLSDVAHEAFEEFLARHMKPKRKKAAGL